MFVDATASMRRGDIQQAKAVLNVDVLSDDTSGNGVQLSPVSEANAFVQTVLGVSVVGVRARVRAGCWLLSIAPIHHNDTFVKPARSNMLPILKEGPVMLWRCR